MNRRYALGMTLSGVVMLIGAGLIAAGVYDGITYAVHGDIIFHDTIMLAMIGFIVFCIGGFMVTATDEITYDY